MAWGIGPEVAAGVVETGRGAPGALSGSSTVDQIFGGAGNDLLQQLTVKSLLRWRVEKDIE